MTNTKQRLGVDIGGVIIGGRASDANKDTSFFSDNYLRTPATEGVFEALRILNQGRFKDEVYLVSKCGPKIQARSKDWLHNRGFTRFTGIPINDARIHFCIERHEKAPICEQLGITHFIDDKLEVLSYLPFVKSRYLYQPNEKEVRKYAQHLKEVTRVDSWKELVALLQK